MLYPKLLIPSCAAQLKRAFDSNPECTPFRAVLEVRIFLARRTGDLMLDMLSIKSTPPAEFGWVVGRLSTKSGRFAGFTPYTTAIYWKIRNVRSRTQVEVASREGNLGTRRG
jgi:hypothetical protein